MPTFIATYDLNNRNSPHEKFRDAALRNDWQIWILSSDKKWYRLPNTTLVGTFSNRDAAVAAFKAIQPDAEQQLGSKITVEKWIVAEYSGATFNSDESQES